jgi:5'(3')-deoxyribonucleotidase
MGKPVIAVDIDDVIFPFVPEIIKHFNMRRGATITIDDFSVYHFSQVWGSTEEEANAIVAEFLKQDVVHLLPIEGAQQAFSRLSRDFTIVLVTARNGLFAPSTQQWLEAHFKGLFNDVIFAGNPHDTDVYREKGIVCEELGAILLIDDSPDNLRSALDHGTSALLFGMHNWNRQHDLPTDIARCESWEEATKYIYKTFPVAGKSDVHE